MTSSQARVTEDIHSGNILLVEEKHLYHKNDNMHYFSTSFPSSLMCIQNAAAVGNGMKMLSEKRTWIHSAIHPTPK